MEKTTQQFKIRKATTKDILKARRMQAAAWLVTYPSDEDGVPYDWVKQRTDSWFDPEKLIESEKILKKVIDDPTQFYRLAEKDNEVVGFIHVLTKDDGSKELEAIYTSPETFGSGLGHALMEQADVWINGAPTNLKVATYNKRAIRFYEKHGFKIIEGSNSLYRDKMPVVQMERKGTNQ